MKNALFGILVLMAVAAPAYAARYAHIVAIRSNQMFPVSRVAIEYQRECNESFQEVLKEDVYRDNKHYIGLGVVVEKNDAQCIGKVNDAVTVDIYAEDAVEFYDLGNAEEPDHQSGSSVGNMSGSSVGNMH